MRVYDKQLERVTHAKFKIHLAGEACCGRFLSRASLHIYAAHATRQTELHRLPACQPGYRHDIWMRGDVDSISPS